MVVKPLLALAALSLLTSAAANSPWTSERSQAVVRLEIPIPGGNLPRVGTGFVVRGQTSRYFVVSATHTLFNAAVERRADTCVELPKGLRLLLGGNYRTPLIPHCVYNLSSDISLIELLPSSSAAAPYPSLSLDVRELVRTETLYVAGFPFGYSSLDDARSGIVTELDGDKGMAVVSALTAVGMSGGPYIRQDGSVVAIHHGQSGLAAGFAHAVHVARMRVELERLLPKLPAQSEAWFAGQASPSITPLGMAIALRQVESPEVRKQIYIAVMGKESLTRDIEKLLAKLPPDPGSTDKVLMKSDGTSNALTQEKVISSFVGKRKACLDGDNIAVVDGLLYCNNESQVFPSPNYGRTIAPQLVVLHTTQSTNAESVIRAMVSPDRYASDHLVIDRDGSFLQLVNFERQAWHAGQSSWQGMQSLNGVSIGITLVNGGPLVDAKGQLQVPLFGTVIPIEETELVGAVRWHKFTPFQMAALDKILRILAKTYPLTNIVGHCEVTKTKFDPGPLLPVTEIERRILDLASSRPYQCATPGERLTSTGKSGEAQAGRQR